MATITYRPQNSCQCLTIKLLHQRSVLSSSLGELLVGLGHELAGGRELSLQPRTLPGKVPLPPLGCVTP